MQYLVLSVSPSSSHCICLVITLKAMLSVAVISTMATPAKEDCVDSRNS